MEFDMWWHKYQLQISICEQNHRSSMISKLHVSGGIRKRMADCQCGLLILILFLFRHFVTWMEIFDEFFDALVVSN